MHCWWRSARELREELGVDVVVGARLGGDVALTPAMTLRAYLVTLTNGIVQPHDHRALRWITCTELRGIEWVPADTAWLPDLQEAPRLDGRRREGPGLGVQTLLP